VIEPEDVLVDHVGGTAVVRVSGDIDLSNAALIKRSITESISNQESKLVVDLEAVRYLDSAGIAMLFDLSRRLGQHLQQFVLVVPQASPLRRSLRVSGWPADAPIVESIEGAIGGSSEASAS
jgi:anti-anti-sigma factor